MKKIFAISFAALLLASCNMDFYSSDSMTSSQLADNPASAVYTTDGIYALYKGSIAYKGESEAYPNGRNQYLRHYFQLSELRGDNVTVSGVTSDPFIFPYAYEDVPTTENMYYTWWMNYKIIYAANSNIDAIKPGVSEYNDHLLGENYFFRAFAHFHLVTLWAQPYVYWKDHQDTPGVIVHRGMDSYNGTPARSTVGLVYEGIVEDLKSAIQYLSALQDGKEPRAEHCYVTLDAAKAFLSRVYLYMEMNDECIEICNQLMEHAPVAVTDTYDFEKYPTSTWTSDETIWCIRQNTDDKFFTTHPTSSIGSMYYNDGTQGWGEHYWNDDLIDMFQRYPQDKRFAAYFKMKDLKENGKKMITFPYKTKATNTNCSSYIIHDLTPNADGSIDFSYNGSNYKAVPDPDKYNQYYVDGIDLVNNKKGASYKSRVYVREDIAEGVKTGDGESKKNGVRDNGGSYVIYYNTKFSGQDGSAMLTSPVFFRWGEVVLNRAEAKAKKNDATGALADVNIIRKRAGLPDDAMFSATNMHGYTDALDVVLDERRMELCFEGHRVFDVFRNRRNLDRRYVGYHEYGEIPYGDKRIALLIPTDEINSSHIEQNPR